MPNETELGSAALGGTEDPNRIRVEFDEEETRVQDREKAHAMALDGHEDRSDAATYRDLANNQLPGREDEDEAEQHFDRAEAADERAEKLEDEAGSKYNAEQQEKALKERRVLLRDYEKPQFDAVIAMLLEDDPRREQLKAGIESGSSAFEVRDMLKDLLFENRIYGTNLRHDLQEIRGALGGYSVGNIQERMEKTLIKLEESASKLDQLEHAYRTWDWHVRGIEIERVRSEHSNTEQTVETEPTQQ